MNTASLPLWLTEDVTWPVLWGLLAVGIFCFTWFLSQRIAPLVVAFICLLLVVGAIIVEMQVVTDREYLVNAVYTMADSVRNNDADGVAAFISDELPDLKATIHREKEKFQVDSCSIIGFRNTDLFPNEKQATEANIGFSVFGSGSFRSRNASYTGPLSVDLKFKKINGQWSIVEFSYSPTNAPNKVRTYN